MIWSNTMVALIEYQVISNGGCRPLSNSITKIAPCQNRITLRHAIWIGSVICVLIQRHIVETKAVAQGQGRVFRERYAGADLESGCCLLISRVARSEEHTSELQSLMRISYAVFCLKKKKT